MAYQVIARKWRPQRFADVVGQEHISRTLQNAILQGRVGHAYLFIGPRGIGKTTTARIFAKALNCEAGVVAEPCCECNSCREITAGNSLDVIEIDGASHNGVDDIRDLRDAAQYTPSRGRYKIFIIDEVHMLSPQAWNALLKTLEEPPPHVKFIFATTEPRKVLPTVLSRCQRLDLKRIPAGLIAGQLRHIADAEKVAIDDRALAAIARAADGGMRDAQSIFDQMIAFHGGRDTGQPIAEPDVMEVFGLASGAEIKTLVLGLAGNDLAGLVQLVNDFADRGRDLEQLLADLTSFLRNVMICQLLPDPGRLLDASAAELDDLREVGAVASPVLIPRLLEAVMSQDTFVKNALNKRIALEVALVRTIRDAHSVQIDEVIQRLQGWREGGIPPDGPRPSAAAVPLPAAPPRAGGAALPPVAVPVTPPSRAPAPISAVPAGTPAPVAPPSLPPAPVQTPPPSVALPPAPVPAPAAPLAPESQPNVLEVSEWDVLDADAVWAKLRPALEPFGGPGGAVLRTALDGCRPMLWTRHLLTIGFPSDLAADLIMVLEQAETLSLLSSSLARLGAPPDSRVLAKRLMEERKPRLVSSPVVRARVEQHPLVQEVAQVFGATVIDVRGTT